MTAAELDVWWEGHPRSVQFAAQRYRPHHMEEDDFQSELYVHCRARLRTYHREHPVSHWLCLEAQTLRNRLTRRAQRDKRDARVSIVELDAMSPDDQTAGDMLQAPDYPIDTVLDLDRALSETKLSATQSFVLHGSAYGYSNPELAGFLKVSEERVRHAKSEARRALAIAYG